jgi:tetratricopeptide (TPR) repeat protein/tRNA A-37 threonylcarbamoyl transferase component Bud32
MIGKTISHYRIVDKIGGGGMGVVYKAEDARLKRIVALKFLSPELTFDETAKTRFMQEAQAASALQHNNICTIHDIDQTADGQMFICMDYYTGETLKNRIERGALPLQEAIDIALQAAEGLAKAHEAGMVHRDIKPANITVTQDGVTKILDFGLAKLGDTARVTKTGTTVGTIAYMSPEQARGEEAEPTADVWSLGAVLYEMVTARLPFSAEHEAAMIYAIINETHAPLQSHRENLPPKLAKIVDKALSKNPRERYSDASEMASDLADIKSEMTTSQRAAAGAGAAPAGIYRRSLPVIIPIALAALVVFAILVLKPLFFVDELVSAPRPIAVISFENQTGDSQYDYLQKVIPNLLITSLEQSKYLSVITWERMHDLLVQAGWEDVEVIDKETGFEVCRLDGIDTIVFGTFSKAGDVFVTDVKVLDVHSKELLNSASSKGTGVESILSHQIDEIGKQISRGVGLSERTIEASAQPIAEVTTRSMNAYHFFVRGREQYAQFYKGEAQISLETAVELDSTFATAWLYLARVYHDLRYIDASNEAYAKAKALSASAPEKDRLYIDALYATNVERDDDTYFSLLQELTSKYPKEKLAHLEMGIYYRGKDKFAESEHSFLKALALDPNYGEALNGIAYTYANMERYDQAIAHFERYAEVHPEDANPYDSTAELYVRMGRLNEAVAAFKKAVDIKPGFGSEKGLAYIFALKEDYDEALKWMDQFIINAPSAGLMASGRFMKSFFCGLAQRGGDALELNREARPILRSFGHKFGIAGSYWIDGWIYYNMHEYERSRTSLLEANSLMEEIGLATPAYLITTHIMAGLLDLAENHIDEAKSRLTQIDSLLPHLAMREAEYMAQKQYEAGLFHAEVLLAEDRTNEAVAICRDLPYVPMPNLSSARLFFYSFPIDRDVLARALVRRGALDDAIQEYERLVTFDPAGNDRRLINPKFHYRLGVLYEQKGFKDKAIQEYKKFIEICGNVEPPLVEVEDARLRLAALSTN